MSSKHLTCRVSEDLFKEIEALKPAEIKMSPFIALLVEAGMKRPDGVRKDRAIREVELNVASNMKHYEEVTKEEKRNQQDAFHLSQGHMTFNEIIEKHKEELEKKYK